VDKPRAKRSAPAAESSATVCPRFHAAVELIGRRWVGVIIVTLLGGPHYFRDLGAAVPGLSDRLLSRRLRELERAGLVERRVHDGPPARVSYALTEPGRALEPVIEELHEWAQHWEPNGDSTPA
jgi:DNA-binding HxlR family transcriptional regulator